MAPSKESSLGDKAKNSLKDNPTAIGDPISIKDETTPSEHDLTDEQKKSKNDSGKKSLKEVAQESNPTMLGDPVSLKAETSDNEPTEQDRGTRGTKHDKMRDSKL